MSKTTQSGYSVRIDLFFPCHPDDIEGMRAADHAIGLLLPALDDVSNVATVLIGRRKWIAARRKIPAPLPNPQAQDGAAPEDDISASSGAAVDEIPGFLDRRAPR